MRRRALRKPHTDPPAASGMLRFPSCRAAQRTCVIPTKTVDISSATSMLQEARPIPPIPPSAPSVLEMMTEIGEYLLVLSPHSEFASTLVHWSTGA